MADTPVQPQPVSVALLPEFKLDGAADARRETVDRTLFNPTRRPAPPAPPPAAAAPSMAKGTFALTGTTVVEGRATAFLREVNGGKVRRVQKGELVNGMLVDDVKADRVRFTLGGDAEEVTMKIATGPRTTIQPVVPGTPPAGIAGQPPAGAAPTPAGAAQPSGVPDVADILAQRRRAARAAEAAGAQPGAAAPASGSALPAAASSAPAQAAQAAAAPAADPTQNAAWSAVYQRMQQGRKR